MRPCCDQTMLQQRSFSLAALGPAMAWEKKWMRTDSTPDSIARNTRHIRQNPEIAADQHQHVTLIRSCRLVQRHTLNSHRFLSCDQSTGGPISPAPHLKSKARKAVAHVAHFWGSASARALYIAPQRIPGTHRISAAYGPARPALSAASGPWGWPAPASALSTRYISGIALASLHCPTKIFFDLLPCAGGQLSSLVYLFDERQVERELITACPERRRIAHEEVIEI
jgi:hypothetical protein